MFFIEVDFVSKVSTFELSMSFFSFWAFFYYSLNRMLPLVFSLMKEIGSTIISLYTRVPRTNRIKPANSPQMKCSVPMKIKTIQITSVLLVSTVDL